MHPQSSNPAGVVRLAVVGRVSTEEQERHGTSLEDQARKGELLAQLHSMQGVDSRAYQGDESGALPLAARPIMRRVIADPRARKFDAVCFHKIDRIARRLKYILEIWDELTEAGVTVYIIDPAIDTSTIMGRLLRNVLGTIAEFERDLIQERTSGGREREIAAGAVYAPRGKYGYEYVRRDRARGITPHVQPHPEHAEVVRRMYRLGRQNWSCERIATQLTAERIPTPSQAAGHKRQSERWHEVTVAAILRDPTYMGEGSWGATTWRRDKVGRRRRTALPQGRTATPIAYPALVEREEWMAANRPASERGTCARRARVEDHLFCGGMARCAGHGTGLTGSRDWEGQRRYRCTRKLLPGGRTTHSVPAGLLEERVWAKVLEAMLDEEHLLAAAEAVAREAENGVEEVARRRAQVAARLEALERERREFFTQMRKAGASASDMAEQVRLMREEESSLRSELEPLAAQMALHQANLPRAEQVRSLCALFVARANGASAQTKRELLDALEVTVVLTGTRFRVEGVLSALGLEGT
jgi:DNA invertase Pin-like site-specific DNA recombinase